MFARRMRPPVRGLLLGFSLPALAAAPLNVSQKISTPNTVAHGCPVYHAPPPSEASLAFRRGDLQRAEALYRSAMESARDESSFAHAASGLVDVLAASGKSAEAVTLAQDALKRYRDDAVLLDAYGRVRLRRGEMAEAAQALAAAQAADPCNSRIHYDLARYLHLAADYRSERDELEQARTIEPDNSAINFEWKKLTRTESQQIQELQQRVAMAQPDSSAANSLNEALSYARVEEGGSCKIAPTTSHVDVPLFPSGPRGKGFYAAALDIHLDGKTERLELDTGASGITLSRKVAEKAGIKLEASVPVGGVGDHSGSTLGLAHVPLIQIGDLILRNCLVEISDRTLTHDVDGAIGADVFAQFLVTVDVPSWQMQLTPLPPLPTPGPGMEFSAPEAELSEHPALRNRYIDPSMGKWMRAYRSGPRLYILAHIDDGTGKLFLLDTGTPPDAVLASRTARDITGLIPSSERFAGANGGVDHPEVAREVSLRFDGFSEKLQNVPVFDLGAAGTDAGSEVAGILGFGTLQKVILRIDYRDSLIEITSPPRTLSDTQPLSPGSTPSSQ